VSVHPVRQAHRLCLDGDSTLALEFHAVQELGLSAAGLYGSGQLQQAVGERRLAMVDMRNYAEIPYVL
jgi:hypothetical protein